MNDILSNDPDDSFTVDPEENESVTLTLYHNHLPIGTLNYILRNQTIYINEMDIQEAYQNQGYGRKLVTFFLRQIPDAMAVELTAAKDAYQFWEKMGFTQVRFNHQLVYNYVMRQELKAPTAFGCHS